MPDFKPFVPKGQINIYRFVPLDETYTNTLHFENRAAQLAYFGCVDSDTPSVPIANTIMKLKFVTQTFTRNERQYVRINANACNLYDCNYMAFQNRDFGEMWFFAFIHSVEYVNDYVSDVEFELDVMQTFMWNYELRECFVEREHSLTDYVGDSLTPEKIIQPVYKNVSVETTTWFDKWNIGVLAACELHPNSLLQQYSMTFTKLNGMPMGGDLTYFEAEPPFRSLNSQYTNLPSQLQTWTNQGALEAITTLFLFPSFFSSIQGPPTHGYKTIAKPVDVDGLNVINKEICNCKLLTYPYTFLNVDCGNNQAVYKFEFFENTVCLFNAYGVACAQPQIILKPENYNQNNYMENMLVMENFPKVCYGGDNFANWWGQNATSTFIRSGLDLAELGIAIGSENIGLGISSVSSLTNEFTNYVTNSNKPPTLRSTGCINSGYTIGELNFYFCITQPNAESAKIIDDYFTMFGYNTQRVKVPNIRNYSTCRPHFNYLKCGAMSFHWEEFKNPQGEGKGTSVPQKYMKQIIEIYQRGITFWKNPDEVGRYDTFKTLNVPNERGYRT